ATAISPATGRPDTVPGGGRSAPHRRPPARRGHTPPAGPTLGGSQGNRSCLPRFRARSTGGPSGAGARPAGRFSYPSWKANGVTVAVAAIDRTVRQWELPTGKERPAIELAAPVSEIAFAPNGERLATLSSGLELWDPVSSKRLSAVPEVNAFQMAYCANGTM